MLRRIVCTACGQHVYDLRDGVAPGDPMLFGDFTSAHPDVQPPISGQEIRCPLCGSQHFIQDVQEAVRCSA